MSSTLDNVFLNNFCNGQTSEIISEDPVTYAKSLFQKKYIDDENREMIQKESDLAHSDYCKPYIIKEREPSCRDTRRTDRKIMILHVDSKIKQLKFTQEFCGTDQPIDYELVYLPVAKITPDVYTTFLETMEDICNEAIIYFDVRKSQSIDKLTTFLKNIKDFNTTTLFLNTRDDMNAIVTNSFIKQYAISGLKILNIVSRSYLSRVVKCSDCYDYKRYTINDVDYLTVKDDEIFGGAENLECTWWFQYFINKAFGCGAGRLIQLSGTCYLNAVINGIILSQDFRNIFITYMKRQLAESPKLHSYVKQDLSSLECMRGYLSELAYIYRIVYNIVCKKTSLKPKHDIFTKVSKKYFSSNYKPQDKLYGEGGSPKYVLYDILSKTGIKFLVYSNKLFSIPNRKHDIQKLRNSTSKQYFNSLLTQDIDSKDFDVILYMNIKIDEKIEEKLSFNGNEFDLDFCIIYFQIEKLGDFHPTKPSVRLPNKKSAHVILVYKCDGYYKIYDSSMNMIETIWTKLTEQSTFLRLESFIKKMWLGGNIIKIDNIHIESSVYVNKNKSDMYSYTGSC